MDIIVLIAVLGLSGFLVWDRFFKPSEEKENVKKQLEDVYREKITDLEVKLRKAESDRDELSGKGKQMFAQLTSLKEKNESLDSKVSELSRELTTYKNNEEQEKKDIAKKITELTKSTEVLEDEKMRLRREDKERLELEEAERDRVWNEHENVCLSLMREVCQKPELAFNFYDNGNLPHSFDGTLKPDFLVEFLGQYIVFDAKMSRSANLQTYLNEQVKKTVKKIKASKNNDEIYQTVFFMIPTVEIATLKKTHFYEDGYSFYIVPIESFEAIIASYKKVTNYELAESFDPQERENIVNLIASYDQHISRQNAINLLTSIEGLKVMHQKGSLNDEIRGDVETTKKKMRLENLKPTDLKRFIQNPGEQINAIKGMIETKDPSVTADDMGEAQRSLLE